MQKIVSPLLATKLNPDVEYQFPMLISAKKDGIRTLIHPDGDPQSRSGEYLQNPCVYAFTQVVRHYLTNLGLDTRYYLDGELLKNDIDTLGNHYDCQPNDTTGLVNSYTNVGDLTLYLFDLVDVPQDETGENYFPVPFNQRYQQLINTIKTTVFQVAFQWSESGLMHIGYCVPTNPEYAPNNGMHLTKEPTHIPKKYQQQVTTTFVGSLVPLTQHTVYNWEQVDTHLKTWLASGDEGAMLRNPNAGYKFGRCAAKQDYLLKIKPFEDSEALIVGFEQATETLATGKKTDKLGKSKTNSKKGDKVPVDRLGKFVVEHPDYGQFKIGTGFDHDLATRVWHNQQDYLGKLITFRYQKVGMVDKPRIPSFVKFRDSVDIS